MSACRAWRRVRLVALLLVATAVSSGCERLMRDMYEQPKLKAATTSPLFDDGLASRPPPRGSVARAKGDLAATSGGRLGGAALDADLQADIAERLPERPGEALLLRGQERYTIYCMPCHSPAGDGDGPVVRRGFPAPPSYHSERLRHAPDRHYYDVITHGYGVMYPYADRVAPADRWAIVAYIRALQLSQHAPVAALSPELRAQLAAAASAPSKAPR
ncbi:MAG: c-type cytochrome [Caldimonas sp.]